MAWHEGQHCKKRRGKTKLQKLYDIKGDLSAEDAKTWFFDFCKCNPALALTLLTGVELEPIQDLILRSYILRDFNLMIAGRGFSKTFSVAAFIVYYAIFNPGSKIGICSGSFRQAKDVFKQIEIWFGRPEGARLKREITDHPHHESDSWTMGIADSSITAIPLTERTRGKRFNLVVADELFLIPDDIMNSVILPFLSVEKDSDKRKKIRDLEEQMIISGQMRPEDRTEFPANKMIGLSSATFKADPLYTSYYTPYLESIHNPDAKNINHCVWKLSYEAAPKGYIDVKNVEEARRKLSKARFDMEYRAIFADDSQGYFNWNDIQAATVGTDEYPKNLLKGREGYVYILGMDPHNSDKETSDNFAMCLIELCLRTQTAKVVHCYALAKSSIGKRVAYLKYLMENFNIVYICADAMGGANFINIANELWTKEEGAKAIHLSEFSADFRTEDGVREAKRDYNLQRGKIVHAQAFQQTGWKWDSNDDLKAAIEQKRLMFAARIEHDHDVDAAMSEDIPIDGIYFDGEEYQSGQAEFKKSVFIQHLNEMMEMTKKELRLIDVVSASGNSADFNIPKNLRTSSSPTRDRRDSYTALLLANWGCRCYLQIFTEQNKPKRTFSPILV